MKKNGLFSESEALRLIYDVMMVICYGLFCRMVAKKGITEAALVKYLEPAG